MKRCLVTTLSVVVAVCLTANSVTAASDLEIPKGGWGVQFRWSFADPECQAALKEHQSVMAGLKIAYDNDGLWDWGDPETAGPEVLGKMVDQYADAGARFLVWGCGNHKAWSYTPKVQELWGAKMSKQTFDEHPGWAKMAALLQSYIAAGTDPLSIVLKRAKARKLPVLAGFRDPNRYDKHYPDAWFLANPRFHLSPERNAWPNAEFGVNFALPEVREHKVRQWIDVVERYDVDGLHFEFMRSLPFFEKDEPDKIEHMNALLRMLRKELDRIGQKRGKRLKLSIWLPTPYHLRILRSNFPPDFFDMEAQGLDPETWIKEGLVDILIPSIYAVDLDMPKPCDPPPWVATAKGTSTKVYACVMNIVRKARSGKDYATTAPRTARIIRSLSSQYDGVFFFNAQPYSLAAVLDAAGAEGRSAAKRARVEAARKPRRIIFNDDAEGLLKHSGTGTVEGFLARRLKPLVGTQVDTISWATVTFGDAPVYDCKVQPVWGEAHGKSPSSYNDKNLKTLIAAGHCPLQVVVDFAHANRMEAFSHVRMNDVHDSFMQGMKTTWKRQHPELLVDTEGMLPCMKLYTSSQDFVHDEVRRRKLEIIKDVCERYDVDGFELDYIRHPVLFSRTMRGLPVTKDEVEIMTSLHRRIRKLTDAAGARRGRPVLLAVRVPDTLKLCMNIGLDVKTWLEEDLVDMLIVGGGYAPFSLPVAEFVEAARPYDVPVYPCINRGAVEQLTDGTSEAFLQCTRALAAKWYQAGADGVFPWNACTFPLNKYGPEMIAARRAGYAYLSEIGDAKSLEGKDKLYCVDSPTAVIPSLGGRPYKFISGEAPLPVELKRGVVRRLQLEIADDVEAAARAGTLHRLRLRIELEGPVQKDAVLLRLNGKELAGGEFVPPKATASTCSIDFALGAPPLRKGVNVVEASLAGGDGPAAGPVTLCRAYLWVQYKP